MHKRANYDSGLSCIIM